MKKIDEEFWNSLTLDEKQELADAAKGLQREPLVGFKRFVLSVIRPLKRKDEIEATYAVFKPYYDRAGVKFTRKEAERVRSNVLRVSRKMFEFETGRKEQKNE